MTPDHDDDDPRPRRFDPQLWRRLLVHVRPYRHLVLGLGVSGLGVACIDTALPLVTARLIDAASAGSGWGLLGTLGALYAGLLLVLATLAWGFIAMAGRLATGVGHDLRRQAFAALMAQSAAFFDHRPVGWLVSRITQDCNKICGLLPWLCLDLAWGTSLLTLIAAAMCWLDVRLAAVVFAIVPPLLAIGWLFQQWMLDSARAIRRANAKITSAFNEAIGGLRTTRALAREDENLAEFSALTDEMFGASMRNALQAAGYLPVVMSLGSLGAGLALWRGGVEVGHGLSLGVLVAFVQYTALFAQPIQDMARQLAQLQAAQAAAERVQSLLDAVPAVRSPARPAAPPADRVTHLAFDDVHFGYSDEAPVLRGCSFEVHQGETIALVGPTGGGKSTIVGLLARSHDVQRGAVRVDGVDVRELDLPWLQSRFGVVLQAPHLFSGTIADNIRYGRLDATDAEVAAAAARVCAAPFVEALPDGYATQVGEGGGRLSTGQRQLVSMARAVLADPSVLILDEATSSIDERTERAIQAGLEELLVGRMAVVIAHRLATIRNADRILVVDGGRIVEAGDHAALMARRGAYWRMVAADRLDA
ncbi:MAG: ABC transporter ATP-binding protein [Myxococcota bacterium]